MKLLSNALNGTVIMYLCSLRVCDAIRAGNHTSGHMPAITTSWRGGDITVSTVTVSSGSARDTSFVEITDSSGEDLVTSPGRTSDTTANAPTLDNGCTDGNGTYLCLSTPSGPDFPQENNTGNNRHQPRPACGNLCWIPRQRSDIFDTKL